MPEQDSILKLICEQVRTIVREELERNNALKKEKELMNSKEVCEFLGIHSSTLSKWKAEDKIPYRRLGKRIFFNREEVMQALKDSNYYKLRAL